MRSVSSSVGVRRPVFSGTPPSALRSAFPTVSEIDGEPWLLAFTNVRRLKDFARSVDRVDDDGSVPLLVLDPAESMHKILSVRDAIAGVVFNIDAESTFRAPVQALESYAEHFEIPVHDQEWG